MSHFLGGPEDSNGKIQTQGVSVYQEFEVELWKDSSRSTS